MYLAYLYKVGPLNQFQRISYKKRKLLPYNILGVRLILYGNFFVPWTRSQ